MSALCPSLGTGAQSRAPRARLDADNGSVLPLVLGFWLVAMLFVAGSLALGTAFTRQRSLQSTCDAAALAAANGISQDRLHMGGATSAHLPLAGAQAALNAFLARDPSRAGVHVDAPDLDADRTTVRIVCRTHTNVPFQGLLLRRGGVDQRAEASARTPID